MSMTFTDASTGDAIVLPNNSVQAAYEDPNNFNTLESITGVLYDVSDSWAYIIQQLTGGPPI